MINTYRMLAYIPTSAVVPGDPTVRYADSGEVERAVNQVASFRADTAFYSSGMCDVDLSVRVVADTLPDTAFSPQNGQDIISPVKVAQTIGEDGEYDGFIVLNPPGLCNAITFRGVGGVTNGALFAWVMIGSQEREILVHEFGHALTAYLDTVTGQYTNFPTCGAEPAMHCGTAYGFRDDLDPAWLQGFLSGTLSDSTGINATGWASNTPIQTGAQRDPEYRERMTPWGLMGPLRIGS